MMIEMLTIFQWTILALTALCIGMSKTGVQGLMLLAVPYMAMAFGAKESTGVILPMLCIADIIAVVYYKRIADWKVVAKLLPSAILGFFVAIFVDKLIPANEFRQLMGWTLALALALRQAYCSMRVIRLIMPVILTMKRIVSGIQQAQSTTRTSIQILTSMLTILMALPRM